MNGFEQLHEYILSWTDAGQWQKSEEIVRCRDCRHYESSRWYESAIFPPLGTDIEHVCAFFADGVKVSPDGFCAWGKGGSNERA